MFESQDVKMAMAKTDVQLREFTPAVNVELPECVSRAKSSSVPLEPVLKEKSSILMLRCSSIAFAPEVIFQSELLVKGPTLEMCHTKRMLGDLNLGQDGTSGHCLGTSEKPPCEVIQLGYKRPCLLGLCMFQFIACVC